MSGDADAHGAEWRAPQVRGTPHPRLYSVSDESGRMDWLSWMRVFAICGVVTIHVSGATAVQPDARSTTAGMLAIVLNRGFNFTVPLFVMLSGALLLDPSRYRGDGDFLRRRAVRLIPAIVFWHLFYWAFRVLYLDQATPWRLAVKFTLRGQLFTALYFFWIVLGLAVVTPVLIAWVTRSSRRAVLTGASLGVAMPALSQLTVTIREAPVVWIETPWTWWIPYVGIYLLGWGLRGIVLSRTAVVIAVVACAAITIAIVWMFRRPGVPWWFSGLFGGYYSIGVQVYAALVYLVGQATLRRGRELGWAARGRWARLGTRLGEVTLGVFALHLAVLTVSYDLPIIGGSPAAGSVLELLGRLGLVLVVTFVVVILLRQIPLLKRLV